MILNSEGFSLKSYSSMERKWLVVQRGKLPGGGDWSHQYANLGNTACSEDARVNGDLKLQWYGKPGPYRMFDRHAYTAAPVYSSGRLFTLGEKVLYANDAYNGYLLWEKELPDLEPRVNLPRDCGYMATDGTHVYLAVKDNCIKINAKTGRTEQKYNCQKTDDKYNQTQIPLRSSCTNAGMAKIVEYSYLKDSSHIRDEINRNNPVVIAVKLSPNFYGRNSFVSYAKSLKNGKTDSHASGHAVTVVGYVENPKKLRSSEGKYCYIVANSWGEGWGQGGHSCLSDKWLSKHRLKNDYVAIEKVI